MGKIIGKTQTTDIADNSITNNKLDPNVAGSGVIGGGGSPLSVNVDNNTIEIDSDQVKIKNLGVKSQHIDFGSGVNQVNAGNLPYDNSTSILTSVDAQNAIDEVVEIITPASTTAPTNVFEGMRWLDTSASPPKLMIYQNSIWVEEESFDPSANRVSYDGGGF